MAEQLLQHALAAEAPPLCELQVASFGLSAFPGCPASPNAVHVLSKVGLDLSAHQSRSIHEVDLSRGLLFLCMTTAHRDGLLSLSDLDPDRIFLVREWMNSDSPDIPDPFGGDVRSYAHCRDSIVEAIPSVLEFLRHPCRRA